MADSPLVSKFGGKKRTPKFDDGPPVDDAPRGAGGGVGASGSMPSDGDGNEGMPGGDMSSGGPASSMDPEEKAIDDMSDILGVGPEDRQDFANALQTYVSACIAKNMSPDMGDMSSMGGGGYGGDDGSSPPT